MSGHYWYIVDIRTGRLFASRKRHEDPEWVDFWNQDQAFTCTKGSARELCEILAIRLYQVKAICFLKD